jgi:hypothetical protein
MSVSDDLTSMPITMAMPTNCEGSRYGLVRWGELDLDMLGHELSIAAVRNQDVHLPSVKVGCQRPRGQKRTEMMY